MKRNLVILFSLIFIFSTAGCQQRKSGTERIIIRYVSYEYLPFQVSVHRAIVDSFNKSQEKVFVKFEVTERGTEKILTQIAGGDAPDVFLWFSAHVYDLAKKGALLELTSYIKSSNINFSDYFTDLFSLLTFRLDGRLYAFPVSWGAEALAYNKDLFDKAGLAYPDETWTWEDFVKAAQKFTIRKDDRVIQYGTVLPPEHIVLLGFGGKRFNDELTHCILDSPETKEAFQFLIDLDNKYKVIPSLAALPRGEQYQTAMDMFMTGRVAMYIASSYQLEALRELKDCSWDIAPIPRHGNRKRLAAPGINTLAIYSKTKYPEEAWEFVKFVCGKEGQKLLGKNCIPVHKEVVNEYFCTPPPKNIKIMVDQYEGLTFFSEGYVAWGREFLGNVYYSELDKMLLGLQSVDKTIENMVKEGEKFLRSK